MMKNRILAEMEFASIISEAGAQTQTGAEVLNKYKSHLMANESSCALVNSFVREASMCRYDNGVNEALQIVADYIQQNKTSWALATACESINANNKSYNYINRNAAKQVEKLLEMNEEEVVKYIKAGALKNVMFCESFRNIAKQVYRDMPMVEATAEFTKVTPISLVEQAGDEFYFRVAGQVYKMDENKNICEASTADVSNTFNVIASLLESNNVKVDETGIEVTAGNAVYTVKENNQVVRTGKEGETVMTVAEMRDNNRLVLMTTNPRYRNQMAGVLEAIALVAENYENIVNLDHVAIYTTKNDKFVVIEGATNLYSTLLASNHSAKWTINENAIEALSFIKSKTNTTISENYTSVVESAMAQVDAEEKVRIEEALKAEAQQSYKERIEALTEKFKNDPVKLAVLSKLAQELNEVE